MQAPQDLNPEQQRAVDHNDGPMLVVAGAGTGKTQVITRRIARLIDQGLAKPEEILALTFTEKAAAEMADRLFGLVGWPALSARVMTFNGFGAELLVSYGHHIGVGIRGGLLNDTKKTLLIKQHLDDFSFEYYGFQTDRYDFAAMLVGYIGKLQNAGVTPEIMREYANSLQPNDELSAEDCAEQRDLALVYERYEQLKREASCIDFSDQLTLPLLILTQRPHLADRLRAQYKYVLVDEYQDTSPVQDALLRQIVPPDGNIFAVGDDDQAIYGFRGADIAGILRFKDHFAETTPVALVQNYRSGQPILDAAYRLIKHNDPDRLESRLGINKQLKAQTDVATVRFTPYVSAADEQAAILQDVTARLAGGQAASTMAVLARGNRMLASYASAMRAGGVPFAISTATNLFEQYEMVQLWHTLTWIGCTASDEAIGHVAVGYFGRLPVSAWQPVIAKARGDMTDVETALRALADTDERLLILVERLDTWRAWAGRETVTALVMKVLSDATGEETTLFEQVRLDATALTEQPDGNEARLSRLQRLVGDVKLFLTQLDDFATFQVSEGIDASLAGYLAEFPRPPKLEVREVVGDPSGVQLLTIHASKGLEFETVYLVQTTQSAWREQAGSGLEVPTQLVSSDGLPAEHEHRRLMYVAVTRAKRELFISAAVRQANGSRQAVSPLLEELLGEPPTLEPAQQAGETIIKSLEKLQRFYPIMQALPARLPFETDDGWIEIGVNDLYAYERDPYDFLVEKVLGLSRPFGPGLSFGSAIHKAIETYYRAQMAGDEVDVARLHAVIDEMWSNQGYESQSDADNNHQRAYKTIDRFFAREAKEPKQVQSVEQTIRLEIPEAKLRLKGRIDATFMTADGLEIRDFKTGDRRNQEKLDQATKDSFQLRAYALAIEELTGVPPAAVTLDYVVTGLEGSASLTPLMRKNFRSKLIKLAESLRARDFTPKTPNDFHHNTAVTYYGLEGDDR